MLERRRVYLCRRRRELNSLGLAVASSSLGASVCLIDAAEMQNEEAIVRVLALVVLAWPLEVVVVVVGRRIRCQQDSSPGRAWGLAR